MADKRLDGPDTDHWAILLDYLDSAPLPDPRKKPSSWNVKEKVGLVASYVKDTIWQNIAYSIEGGAYLAGLSLTLALVDYLGGFLVYKTKRSDSEYRYMSFLNRYMHIYGTLYGKSRGQAFYHDLRDAFVHNLVLTSLERTGTGKRYVLMGYPNKMISSKDSWELISLATFAQAVMNGAGDYLSEVMQARGKVLIVRNFEDRFDLKEGNAAIIYERDYGPEDGPRLSSDFENPLFPEL